ncbi:MAG: NAD(P)/FAD-dependent oxidoreductase [Oscillospiraceae bacterium]|nr:NAD(P)/FAD-dependent oxidoreductase [Oscillospiraceae bacterium]
MKTELLIVGAGAAGMAAALSAWEAGCRDILLADRRGLPGGILPQCLHKGFGLAGYGTELTGPDYAARLAQRLEKTGVRFALGTEVLEIRGDKTAVLSDRRGLTELCFDRLILAAGCREKSIGSLPVAGTRPAGIFTAGQTQEMMNLHGQDPGKEILILGSGDLGMIMARQFTLAGKHVIALVEKDARCGGMARNFHRCIEPYAIPVLYRTTVTQIHGAGRINGVTLRHLDSGREERIPCDTLVTALGLIPERVLVRKLGEPVWLFLAGNCRRVHDLVDSAVAEAEQVGRSAAIRLDKAL